MQQKSFEEKKFEECRKYEQRFEGVLNNKPSQAFIYHCYGVERSKPYMELELYEYESNCRIKTLFDLPGMLFLAAFTPNGLMVFGDTSSADANDDDLTLTLYKIAGGGTEFKKSSFVLKRNYYSSYTADLSKSGNFLAGFSEPEKRVGILNCETGKFQKYDLTNEMKVEMLDSENKTKNVTKYYYYSFLSVKFSDDSKKLFVLLKMQGEPVYRVIRIDFLKKNPVMVYKDIQQKDFTLEDVDEKFFK